MYSLKVYIFLVQICLIVYTKSDDSVNPLHINETDSTDAIQQFRINETENLQIEVLINTESHRDPTKCDNGSCEIHVKSVNTLNVSTSCAVKYYMDALAPYLDVSVQNVTSEHSGTWKCTYTLTDGKNNQAGKNHLNGNFELEVIKSTKGEQNAEVKDAGDQNAGPKAIDWIYVGSGIGVGVLILLVIIIQTYYIIHFKRKARAIRREAQWSNRTKGPEDGVQKVRYSEMPGYKKKEVLIPEARESVIYEVLENIRGIPEPPPLESLPSKKEVPETPVQTESPAGTPKWGTLTWNSLLRRKNKKVEESGSDSISSTLDKRTTLDRIKERPPLGLPIEDDIYEAMEATPQPTRKNIKTRDAQKPAPEEEFTAFRQPKPKVIPPIASTIGNVAPALNSQLQQAVEKRNRLNSAQPLPPPKPKAVPKQKPWPAESPVPKPKLWPKESPLPKPKVKQAESPLSKPKWPKEPTTTTQKERLKEPTTGNQKWPREPPIPKQKVWPPTPTPQPQEPPSEEDPTGPLRPKKPTPYNPGLPPPHAPPAKIRTPWGEAAAKKPPPPVKPKQLHPLPPTPSEPESIHVVNEDGDRDSDDSEEWTYEPLPQYNIYSN